MRDDFTTPTKEKLAHRAGYRCSKPDCGITTRGAGSDDDKTINVGFAAHITAASPNGPRFDPTLTSEQRKDQRNGIWLCGTHAKLVDSDGGHFTVEELISWKRIAEKRSFTEVISSKPSPAGTLLADDEDVQTAVDLLLHYSKLDLSAFQRMPGWPSHAIALNLKIVEEKSTQVFTASSLTSAIEVFDEIAVIAPPGTGKTTTLLQLVEAILSNSSSVAVFIPLSEWSTRSDTFFQSLVRRATFRDAKERQFELLGKHGRLVLILDGWNELDEVSKRRVRNDVKCLRRDFPDIGLVVSSRHRDFDIPIEGPVVQVDVLTEGQQLEIARALRGSEGESLMDHAWRTPGLRELVAIPLYLTALLKQTPGGSLPTTKEEVLRCFVTEVEKDTDKRTTLRKAFQGFHRDLLIAIAAEATRAETVALSEAQARAVVNDVQEGLKADKQIAEILQPMNVLDALVSVHMLVRSSAEAGGVSFQHQQFQEWFASFWVEKLMLSATSGDNDAKKTLREDVLNIPIWEEAVLFACDRLSRADQGSRQAVASAIIETLGIDPLLSAEMIYRASDEAWEEVGDHVMSFVKKWHTEGCVDRAVHFMIDTGRAEFSQYIWPLISNQNDQVHLRALRAGHRFKPSVLGLDLQDRIAALPEEVRKHVLAEIVFNGGMDGIELATLLAKNDTSSEVKKAIVDSLLFRCADRFAKDILSSASDEVWRSMARKWHPNEFADPKVSARIEKEAAELLVAETNPGQVLITLLSPKAHDSETGPKIRELIEKIDFSGKSQDNAWLVNQAYELYPGEIVGALVSQLEQSKPLPFGTEELLRKSDVVIDDGPLVNCVLQNSGEGKTAETAVSIVGPRTVDHLIDQMFGVHTKIKTNDSKHDDALRNEYHRLSDWISKTKPNSFIQAILERAGTENPDEIALLADLISRHGKSGERGPLRLDPTAHGRVTAKVQEWAKTLLASVQATRAQFAEIAGVAERLESPLLVPVLQALLSKDLSLQRRAIEERSKAHKNGRPIQSDAHMCWTLQYSRAFAAIGDEQTVQIMKAHLPNRDFGLDAAHVLKEVWRKSQHAEDETGFIRPWSDFSVVPDEYTKRQTRTGGDTQTFVNDILDVIIDLIKPGAEEADYKHALGLATVAFSMPYVDKADTITSLLKLPLPASDKQGLLTVLILSGEVISAQIVHQGIDELLEKAKTNPWMLQEQSGWRIRAWLRLLPFTENPGSILNVFDHLKGHWFNPWDFHDVLSALRYAPSAEAENVLRELAKRDERFLNQSDWLAALTQRNTLTAARILLNLVCSESFPSKKGSPDRMDFGRSLSAFMISHKKFRKEVYDRFPSLTDGSAKSVLASAIVEAADAEGVLLLVREGAIQNKPFRATSLYTALRRVLIGQTPMEASGMHQMYSLPAPDLRRELFKLAVNGTEAESRLATECLTAIDEIRDDYGHVDTEPRHPDITMGVPWPKIDLA